MEKEKASLFEKLGLTKYIPIFMLTRTEMCQHKGRNKSCCENVIVRFYETLMNLLLIKMAANNVFYLANPKKLLKNFMSTKSQTDNFKFALFLALMNATNKFVLCAMRRKCKTDKINSVVAALIASPWILLEPKKRRLFMSLLLFSRGLDTFGRQITCHKMVPEVPYFNIIMFLLGSMMQQYAFCYESDTVNPAMVKFLLKWGQANANYKAMKIVCNDAVDKSLKAGFLFSY